MALPFLKSKPKVAPVDRVKELSGKGFSDSEIVDILRKDGYQASEVDAALTQSMRYEATRSQTTERSELELPTLEDITPETKPQMPQIPETSLPQQYYQEQAQQFPTEEYVDYIVQARMGELNEKIVEVSVKIQGFEKRLTELGDRINEILSLRNAEQTQILSRIDTFKDSAGGVETRIGALEKAFRQTLPALIESVRALSDLVQRMKSEA
ncbi:MAG: hypothetical protein HYT70_00635 [Candidatus Aenigmarchaeota archaeon]|nr:hypothetical protein [Candidatus Aenigmarchaeota archaeon]